MSDARRNPENDMAAETMVALKLGTPILGWVESFLPRAVCFKIYIPGVGYRQVFVRGFIREYGDPDGLWHGKIGQPETLQCVPDPARPGKYKFRVMKGSEL